MQLNFYSFKKTFFLFLPFILRSSARKRLVAACGFIVLDILAASLIPYCAKQSVDGLSQPITSTVTIFGFVILLGIFWTIDKVSSHIQEIIFFPVVNTAIRELNSQVVQHIHSVPMQDYYHLSCPEILSSLKRISLSARSFIKIICLMLIPTTIKLMITLFVCIKMGIFGLALLPGVMISCWVLYRGTLHYVASRDSTWEITDAVTMRINDSIANTKLARFFLDTEMKAVNTLLEQEALLWNKTNIRLHSIHLTVGLLLGATISLILFQACQAVTQQTLTVGDFVMLKAQLIAAFLPFKNLSLEFRQLAESVIDIGKIRRILEIPIQSYCVRNTDLRFTDQRYPVLKNKNGIVLKEVSFAYRADHAILSNFSFMAAEGDKIAIVGDNGCGKSSTLALMAGLLYPDKGQVHIHGRDPRLYSPAEYCQILHYIPQEIRLFNQTLRDNILYGCQKVQADRFNQVVELCGLDALFRKASKGLETTVGDMGIRLSGGEKQRLALSRALLLKPDILLLDETLDALKLENEKDLVQELFSTISTIVIVSHHPHVMNWMDKVFTLKAGKLYSLHEIQLEPELCSA